MRPFFTCLCLTVLFALTAAASAQQASYTRFGTSPGNPRLQWVGLPRIGSTFAVGFPGVPCNCSTCHEPFLVWGTSSRSWGGTPLPLNVDGWQLGSNPRVDLFGTIYVSIDLVQFLPALYSTVAIPNSAALLGVSFFNQGVLVKAPDPRCQTDGEIVFGDAGHGVIGL